MTTYANTVEVMERHRFDARSLERYLRAHLDGYRGGLSVRQFDSGHSNPTFFLSAEMEDGDLFALVRDHNGITWEDDVFELFFKPAADKLPYYEFQVNAANAQLELFLPSRGAGGYRRFGPVTRLGTESAVRLDGTLNKWEDRDVGWSCESEQVQEAKHKARIHHVNVCAITGCLFHSICEIAKSVSRALC